METGGASGAGAMPGKAGSPRASRGTAALVNAWVVVVESLAQPAQASSSDKVSVRNMP